MKQMGMVINKTLLQNLQQTNQANVTGSSAMANDLIRRGLVVKPQKLFLDKLDNSYLPFLPKLRIKPNQLVPLPGNIKIH